MIEAVERLNQSRGASWLTAEAYHTNDSINDVIRYFKKRTESVRRDKPANVILQSLMRDNWKLQKGPLVFPLGVFIAREELRAIRSADQIVSTLGVVVLGDSFVRIHLMSPHPDPKKHLELVRGTMITVIRERFPEDLPASEVVNETAYTGEEVTRKARVRNKPEPDYPGGGLASRAVLSAKRIVLRAILASDGEVRNIVIVEGHPDDAYTQAAVKAARRISFDPAIKDGRYVSQWVQLEYNFYP